VDLTRAIQGVEGDQNGDSAALLELEAFLALGRRRVEVNRVIGRLRGRRGWIARSRETRSLIAANYVWARLELTVEERFWALRAGQGKESLCRSPA
jgi:hypothetical protein